MPISLKRTYAFLLRGPILGVFGVMLNEAVVKGRAINWDIDEGTVMAFIFSLVVSAITRPVDGYFAHVLPVLLRAPLTAIAGATIAVGLLLSLVGKMVPQQTLMSIAIIGASCRGVCSLSSHDDRS
jgi:hypothetical protein